MKNSKIIYFIIIFILVSFFYVPEIIRIFKLKNELKEKEASIEECKKKKLEFQEKIKNIKNETTELEHIKDEEVKKLKDLSKLNYLYMEGIDEEKSDSYLTERRNEEMAALIKIYENNHISSYNTINTLRNYFQSNKLMNYYNSRSNIFLISSIIKTESDLNFLYNEVITFFFQDDTETYILGPPCFKATMDTNEPYRFQKRCNKIENTIMLIKTNRTRLGGITELAWGVGVDRMKSEYEKTRTRLFNLDNKKVFLYNKNQTVSKHIPPIRAENYYFAIFGYNDLYIGYLPWDCRSGFPQMFLGSKDTEEDFNDLLNQKIEGYPKNKEIQFEYEEIEVYPINILL